MNSTKHGSLPEPMAAPFVPREWVLVLLFVVDDVVERIGNGTISSYSYDPNAARLIKRK